MNPNRLSRKKFQVCVLTLSALAAAASSALLAQTVPGATTISPTVLVRFSGTAGSAIGSRPYGPPLLTQNGLSLHGTTLAGGPGYGAFGYEQGTSYVWTRSSGIYQSAVLDVDYGHQFTSAVLDTQGVYRAGAMQAGAAGGNGTFFSLSVSGTPTLDAAPDAGVVSATDFAPKGQLAIDGNDNIYFSSGNESAICTTANRNSVNTLWKKTAAGAVSRAVSFCDFLTQSGTDSRGNPLYLHTKGGLPVALVWSAQDQALYGVTQVISNAVDPSLPSTDNGGKAVGTLFRIGKAALDAGITAADGASIEVLHTFALKRDGAPSAQSTIVSADARATALVEDGEFLYGTSYYNGSPATSAGGTVWRVRKRVAGSFEVIHTFHADASLDGTAAADGSNPMGPLVRAADGHIYGTTARDTTSVSGAIATGAGTLFRIRTGQAADRSDDQFELLHRFAADSDGARPVGLSLGAVGNGVQKIYGATRHGGETGTVLGAAARTTTGNGTVFAIDIALPTTRFTTALSASAATARVGDTVRLSWATDNAASCTAGGDNGGTWSGAQQTSGNLVPVTGTLTKVGTNTFTLSCDSVNGGPAATQSVSVAVEAVPVVTPPVTGGGGGGGGPLGALLLTPLAGLWMLRRVHARSAR